jgi:hypothetical protein
MAQHRLGFVAHRLQHHGQQGCRGLLSGGQQHIQFPLVGLFGGFLGQLDQAVRHAGHGRQDDHHIVALIIGLGHPLGHAADAVDIGHRCAAEFLNHKGHGDSFMQRKQRR